MRSRGVKYSKLSSSARRTEYDESGVDEVALEHDLAKGEDGIWLKPKMRNLMEKRDLDISEYKKKKLASTLKKEAEEAESRYQAHQSAEWGTVKKILCFAIVVLLVVMAMVYSLPPGFAHHYQKVRIKNAKFTQDAIEHAHKAYKLWYQGRL